MEIKKRYTESDIKPGMGKRLRQVRHAMDLNQTEFGEKILFLKQNTYSHLEIEKTRMTTKNLLLLEKAGLDVDYIVTGVPRQGMSVPDMPAADAPAPNADRPEIQDKAALPDSENQSLHQDNIRLRYENIELEYENAKLKLKIEQLETALKTLDGRKESILESRVQNIR
jgi:transcriptional regulator with XRE-family HTH domain